MSTRRTKLVLSTALGLALTMPALAACEKPAPTPKPKPSPTATATPKPTPTPTPTPSPTPSPTPTPTPSPTPPSTPPVTSEDYAKKILDLDPTAYWRFEEPELSPALLDSSKNKNDMTLNNTYQTVSPGFAGSHSAWDSDLVAQDNPVQTSWVDGERGQVFWFKVAAGESHLMVGDFQSRVVIDKVGPDQAAKLTYDAWIPEKKTRQAITVSDTIDDDTWHMVAIVPDGSAIYLDGVKTSLADPAHVPHLKVMRVSDGMLLDDYMITDKTLTEAHIKNLYAEGTDAKGEYAKAALALKPIAYWQFEEANGSPFALDSTTNGNNLDMNNSYIVGKPGAVGTSQAWASEMHLNDPLVDQFADQIFWFKVPANGSIYVGRVWTWFTITNDLRWSFTDYCYSLDCQGPDNYVVATGLADGNWHMLATYKTDPKVLYLDGQRIEAPGGRETIPGFLDIRARDGALFDEYTLTSKPLTEQHIKDLYETGKAAK